MMCQLAQELIDKIIDTIAADSASVGLWSGAYLMECSLVSRSFRPRCLMHIFSTFELRAVSHEIQKRKIQTLSDIIADHPQIAHYIEELRLELSNFPAIGGIRLLVEQLFIDVMKKISPLRTLTLSSKIIFDLKQPGLLLNNFIFPFIAPSITSLRIRCLGQVPLEVVTSCVNLKSLVLSFASLKGHSQVSDANASRTILQLNHLSYQSSRIALDVLLRPTSCVDLSQLKTMTAYTDHVSLDRVQGLLNLCSNSLEEFHLLTMEDSSWSGTPWKKLDLWRMSHLHTLHLHIPFSFVPSHVEKKIHGSDQPWGLIGDYMP